MNKITRFVSSLSDQKHVELDMLHAILLDEGVYPWDPAELSAAPCLDRLEAAIESVPSAQPVTLRWGRLLQQAEQLWSAE
ncbi:MAG: hypothetical protein AAFW75_03955 [Cyanobacteria bacterium J06636_16]